eukprot:Em0016g116a
MDSYVLAETFKYLYLLFAEEKDLLLDIDQYLFTTEAHLLPLTLSLTKLPSMKQTAERPRLPPHLLQCLKLFRPYSEYDEYEKLLLDQCTSPRFKLLPQLKKTKSERPKLTLGMLDFSSDDHIATLRDLGIMVEAISGGKIQVSHMMQRAKTPADAEEGWLLMQEIMKVMATQHNTGESSGDSVNSEAAMVRVLSPVMEKNEFIVGPAMFGPRLGGGSEFHISGTLAEPLPQTGCDLFTEDITGKIALLVRGGCLFIHKVRNAEKSGAAGVIIADNVDYSATNATRPFSMSGDGTNDLHIPSVFMQQEDANLLRQALASHPVRVMLTGTKGAGNQEVKQPSNAATKEGERAQPDSNHPDPVSIAASVGSAEDSHGADTTQNLGVSQP